MVRIPRKFSDVCVKCEVTLGVAYTEKRRCHGGRNHQFDPKPRPNRTSPELLAKIKEMLDDGCSNREIARTLDTSNKTVAKFFPDSGWTPQQAGEFSAMLKKVDLT